MTKRLKEEGVTLDASHGTSFNFADTEEGKLPSFKVVAYSGAVVNYFGTRLVISLEGLNHKKTIPLLADHDSSMRVGHGQPELVDGKLEINGIVSGSGEAASSFVLESKNGFPFEASVGVASEVTRYVREGEKAVVNGAELKGPLLIIEKGRLREVSVVAMGADPNTQSKVLSEKGRSTMPPELLAFLSEQFSFDEEGFTALSEAQQSKFKKLFDASLSEDDDEDEEDPAPVDKKTPVGLSMTEFAKWSEFMQLSDGNYELSRNALEKNWSVEEVRNQIELADLRNMRAKMPKGGHTDESTKKELKVLECRLLQSIALTGKQNMITFTDEKTLLKHFTPEVIEASENLGEMGLKEYIKKCANIDGRKTGQHFECDNNHQLMEAMQFLQGINTNLAYSNASMPNSFKGMCEIALLKRFEMQPQCTPQLFKTGTNPDFRPSFRMRINAGERWPRLKADGKLEYLSFGEEEGWFTHMDTRGGIITFKEKDVIDDALNVINQIIELMAEGQDTEDFEFGQHFFGSTDGFYEDGVNALYGPDAVLSYANVQKAFDMMQKKKVKKGKEDRHVRIGSRFTLLVPCELEKEAFRLFQDDSNCLDCELNSERAWWRGKIDVKVWDEMGNDTIFPEASGQDWALITQNRSYSPYEITSLQGRKKPLIQRVSLPADCLGMGVRFVKYGKTQPADSCGIVRSLKTKPA